MIKCKANGTREENRKIYRDTSHSSREGSSRVRVRYTAKRQALATRPPLPRFLPPHSLSSSSPKRQA
ncbi:hypothetical protein ACFX14_015597 [Malus domestica]